MSQSHDQPTYLSQPGAHGAVPLSRGEVTLWSVLSHLSYFAFPLIAPLVVLLVLGDRSAFVRHNAVEALNFHITTLLASIVAGLLIIVVVGIVLLPAVLAAAAVMTLVAAIRTYQGEPFRYPLTLRLIS
ncbi:MAG: DUF4870 domain-containing protein [Candidatus Dormibacteraeota bacterium]|nr:DUF4870 domain-containing protein [Candidatus Dormibacteraeota bacterium]